MTRRLEELRGELAERAGGLVEAIDLVAFGVEVGVGEEAEGDAADRAGLLLDGLEDEARDDLADHEDRGGGGDGGDGVETV